MRNVHTNLNCLRDSVLELQERTGRMDQDRWRALQWAVTSGTINKWLTTGKLLLISRPTESRRLSFPDHTVDYEVEELTGVGNRSQINTDDNIVI